MTIFSTLELAQNLPYNLLENLLFLDEFTPPENFLQMNAKQRKEFQSKLRHKSVEATDTNLWIWFGIYTDGKARYSNKSAPRLIYTEFFDVEIDMAHRLVPSMRHNRFDVNPYKYRVSGKWGENISKPATALLNSTAMDILEEYYMPDVFDTRDMLHDLLSSKGVSPSEAQQALDNFTEELK